VIQLPFNVRDNQALMLPTQRVGRVLLPALKAAEKLGLYVMSSASVLQGAGIAEAEAPRLLAAAPGYTLITAALQVGRSTPGVGTALVGMRRMHSVEEALAVAHMPVLQD